LPDGTFLTALINPKVKGSQRRTALPAAVTAGADLDGDETHLARVAECDIPTGSPSAT